MREIIEKLDRILELTCGYGVYVPGEKRLAENESELEYIESKIKFNAIKAIELIQQSDREIAAMEKQPEYEYVKVKSIFDLDREGSINGAYGELYKGDFYPATSETDLVHTLMNDKLTRRVEITPEKKREREVEELAKTMLNANILSHPVWEDCCSDTIKNYKAMATKALEWMESKK